MTRVIGLSGYAGVGKDTFAEYFAAALRSRSSGRCKAVAMAFADALRAEVAAAFGIDRRCLTDRASKESPHRGLTHEQCADPAFAALMRTLPGHEWSPRRVMQLWGTEYRRRSRADYWIDRADEALEALRADGCHVLVMTDCRFLNEAHWIKARGGQVWRITRAGAAPTNEHRSETALDDWPFDLRLPNDWSLAVLERLATDIAGEWLQVLELVEPAQAASPWASLDPAQADPAGQSLPAEVISIRRHRL